MVVLQRNEVSRSRFIFFMAIVLGVSALIGIAANFSGASDPVRVLFVLLALAAAAAIVLSLIQLYAYPRRSQVLLFQNDEGTVIATNVLHEGFKLRFLRDILGENVGAFSDEDHARWKSLEADGFYATMYVHGVRKLVLLRLCTMIFDDVFVADRNNRWEHHDSSRTAEPSFSKREMPPLTSHKSST
jgi:phage shock protein PspC (stress-responsive transcriptional regulator)